MLDIFREEVSEKMERSRLRHVAIANRAEPSMPRIAELLQLGPIETKRITRSQAQHVAADAS